MTAPPGEVTLVRAIQTCAACPAQWDAWDADGSYWYLRYRNGRGSAERQPGPDVTTWKARVPAVSFEYGDSLDGSISLEEFCAQAGLGLHLGGNR